MEGHGGSTVKAIAAATERVRASFGPPTKRKHLEDHVPRPPSPGVFESRSSAEPSDPPSRQAPALGSRGLPTAAERCGNTGSGK